jgi:gliding motility-associated-like protein
MLNSYKIFKLFSISQKLGSKPVFFIFLFFTITTLKAQENLVPNGSFEEYNWCPSFASGYNINASKFWNSPTLASPDYLNACSTDFDFTLNQYYFSVPQNGYGNMYAKDGVAYAFIAYTQNSDSSQAYSEYIQTHLKKTLNEGSLYTMVFYLNNPLLTCINSIGALFTEQELNIPMDSIIQQKPHFQSDTSVFFCDTNEWIEVSFDFIAKGDEKFLTIGVFTSMGSMKLKNYEGNILDTSIYAYFYIDNISLIETLIEIPNIFTPNNDGVNDVFDLSLYSKNIEKLIIFNRWGNTIIDKDKDFYWDGNSNEKQCDDGVYFYMLEFKNKSKKTGLIHLMR